MNANMLSGWDRLRHGGLLLDPTRLDRIASHLPEPLPFFRERELRRLTSAVLENSSDVPAFVTFVLEKICGFTNSNGRWQRGTQIGSEWGRRDMVNETVKPRHLWKTIYDSILPVFIDDEPRLGIGRGRKIVSQTLQWLRASNAKLALITNGRYWRLIYAGLDFDAWCEWDVELWFEEGEVSPQVHALRTLLAPALWTATGKEQPAPLLEAILDSRKGQAELSAELGERVREAVEILVQNHGEALKSQCADGCDPADIYRAAVRIVMRLVVVLFAESRELLPRDNVIYHGAYGINGLLEELEKIAARGGKRLDRSTNGWPRLLALFRLVHQGSHHPELPVPAYGGDLFAPGDSKSPDGLARALAVFETACFTNEILTDRDVHRMLDRITRTRVKIRQGRTQTLVPAPVDFSDLSSEYIGILYEGLLDFELKTAPEGDPVIFLAIGNQPALPLSRLEAMDDTELTNLFEKMKDASKGEKADDEEGSGGEEEGSGELAIGSSDTTADLPTADLPVCPSAQSPLPAAHLPLDERHTTRTRAETWARRAVNVGKLVRKPKGTMTPEKQMIFEEMVSRKASQLVLRVILPSEWYLVRWGGTRKGAGTFYTRPGLAVPTVHRTLRPLAFTFFEKSDGSPDRDARSGSWVPRKPEEILALKVCDPACGSGTFPVAALRFLTDTLFESLLHHGRIQPDGDRAIVHLLQAVTHDLNVKDELLAHEMLPCRPEESAFEPRLKAILRRHVVERCIYGVDIDPLAVELCRLALWIETMDRTLPFSFLDHKIKCGNSLIGAWFDQFQHYPAMAWKNREGGDKGHSNGVHYRKDSRTLAIKNFVKDVLTPDLKRFLEGRTLFSEDLQHRAGAVHAESLAVLSRLHALPVHDSAERARMYRDELLNSTTYQSLKAAMDVWCACWFWPADEIDRAPLPTTLSALSDETRSIASRIAAQKRFFHWELEFPDVFTPTPSAPTAYSGFDAVLGNPPWDIAKPSSMEFFSNIDPLYRSYGKQDALRSQTHFFENVSIERSWLDYSSDFRAQSNFAGYGMSPFGDPMSNEKNQDCFGIARGKENELLHDRWRAERLKSRGFADSQHPFRHQGSADLNLYKLFLELAHVILRSGGRMGFIVPSGLYSDHGTGELRKLFLDRCNWEWLFGFENREAIFEIHRSFKFNPVIIEKGRKTEFINTAFMRRKLEDWEHAETFATPYKRAQVDRFSPKSKSILEIQSSRDLEILEKIYSNSVLLGDDGPNGWGIKYATEFHMTNDSKLFPPRPKWEADGYRPDEYSRWLKGDWRPIEELREAGQWAVGSGQLAMEGLREGDVQRTEWKVRCAQPPYDTLPIPRADIPAGIILSRDADAWICEDRVEDIALPLYEGRMIGQFDFSQKGWVSGKGRTAEWRDIPFSQKRIEPQFIMRSDDMSNVGDKQGNPKCHRGYKLSFMDIASATNERTMISSVVRDFPCGNSAPILLTRLHPWLLIPVLNSFGYDYVARCRCSGLHLNYFVIEDSPLVKPSFIDDRYGCLAMRSGVCSCNFADAWVRLADNGKDSYLWKSNWALTEIERLRVRISLDVVTAIKWGLDRVDLKSILINCDLAFSNDIEKSLNPNGFWRVDKDKEPELRHTVLTLVAFHDLEEKIRLCDGDRDKGIEAFLSQNNGEGWMIPETLRLADYGLGHDDRAKEHQPVASRLGPRFYDWQLAQSPEESWKECHLHARNLLGESGYRNLLAEIEAEKRGEKPPIPQAEPSTFSLKAPPKQGTLFGE